MRHRLLAFATITAAIAPMSARAETLAGSPASMERQHAVAVKEDYSFLRTPAEVKRLVEKGDLVRVDSVGKDYRLAGVSFPATRPEVLSFIEHFGALYHEALGSRLVVTSLTRPEDRQPRNAHVLSVHPAGMAVDLRVPDTDSARTFLERSLLAMEHDGLIDVTRERHPAHYHVAVFSAPYLVWAAKQDSASAVVAARAEAARSLAAAQARAMSVQAKGDSDSKAPATGALLAGLIGAPLMWRVRRKRGRAATASAGEDSSNGVD